MKFSLTINQREVNASYELPILNLNTIYYSKPCKYFVFFQNVEILKDPEAVKQLGNILKTNVRACKALGHPYVLQVSVKLYILCSLIHQYYFVLLLLSISFISTLN
jgi:hypothetical protein